MDAPFVVNGAANPNVCGVCCDSLYPERWQCSDCGLEELCANCHVVTHDGGVLCYLCIMERQERHEVINWFELNELAARDTFRYQLLERCWQSLAPSTAPSTVTAVAEPLQPQRTLTDTIVQQLAAGDPLGARLSLWDTAAQQQQTLWVGAWEGSGGEGIV